MAMDGLSAHVATAIGVSMAQLGYCLCAKAPFCFNIVHPGYTTVIRGESQVAHEILMKRSLMQQPVKPTKSAGLINNYSAL